MCGNHGEMPTNSYPGDYPLCAEDLVRRPGWNPPPVGSLTPAKKPPRTGPMGLIHRALKTVLILPIYAYQFVCRPIMPPLCRYKPSCSDFMMQAIQQKGIVWGLILGTWRLARCNPFGGYGWDPVEAYPPFWTGKKWVWHRPTPEDIPNAGEEISGTVPVPTLPAFMSFSSPPPSGDDAADDAHEEAAESPANAPESPATRQQPLPPASQNS